MSTTTLDLPALQRAYERAQAQRFNRDGTPFMSILIETVGALLGEVERLTAERDRARAQIVAIGRAYGIDAGSDDAIILALDRRGERMEAELARLREEVERLTREAKERYERYNAPAMLALHNLTPGGSEFAGDPDACAAYVRRRFNDEHEAQKKLARQAKELARLRRVEAAAKADHEGHRIGHSRYVPVEDVDDFGIPDLRLETTYHGATEPCPLPTDDDERCNATCAVCSALTGEPHARSGEG